MGTIKPFLVVILIISNFIYVSGQYTSYDELPEINKLNKPAFSEAYPEWGQMMYEEKVNYFKIIESFNKDQSRYKAKSPILRYFKIWRKAVQGFVNEDGTIKLPNPSVFHENQVQANERSSVRSNKTMDTWRFLGPVETYWLNEQNDPNPPERCSWQVNVYSFDVSKSDPNVLYAGTETGFVSKSIDNGLTWEQMGLSYHFGGGITSIAIDPTNPDIVYVGSNTYVHKSEDGGVSWNGYFTQNGNGISKIIVDPSQTDRVICAGSSGVFVSSDGGEQWRRTFSSIVWDIEFRPDNPSIIYALSRSNGSFEFYQSSNGGNAFSLIVNAPRNVPEVSGGLLAVTPHDPNVLYYLLLSENDTPILGKRSEVDGFLAFQTLNTGGTTEFPMTNWQGFFDLVLEANPENSEEIFAGTASLYKSEDGGANFSLVGGYGGNFPVHPDIQCMKYVDGQRVWVSTDGGMNYSMDAFRDMANFSSRNRGLVGSDMWGFDQGWNEDIQVGGRYHNGNTAMADFYGDKALRMGGAESPTGWILQGKSRHAVFDDLGNGWILPKNAEGKPEGRFSYSKFPNMDEYGGRRSNLVHHPNYYGTLFLGQGNGFWKSEDMGVQFDLLFTFPDRVRYLQGAISNPDVFYADVVNHGLYKTEDGGQTWENKTSLTQDYASSYWAGRMFFVVSPNNENHLYSCLQNGTWSSDIGGVFFSNDGGENWTDWTGSLNVLTKNMVIQPASEDRDLVYLFSNNGNGEHAKVYYRYSDDSDWQELGDDFPAGFSTNIGLPFYRDSKLRVSGNGGIWETDLLEKDYSPIINPWVFAPRSNCMLDTLQFEDHSIIDHQGVTWSWEISPAPLFISDTEIRNPKVVLGSPGSYDVSLRVFKNGNEFSKTIANMITTTTCPSLEDCDNPAKIPKEEWSITSFDSEEVIYPGYASMAIDEDLSTIWHTRWSTGSDPYPHELTIDLDTTYILKEMIYYPRTDGQNGRIKDFEIYADGSVDPVATGTWENSAAPKIVYFDAKEIESRTLQLKALSEVNDNAWASCAEIELIGCYVPAITANQESVDDFNSLIVYPMPVQSQLIIDMGVDETYQVEIFSSNGKLMTKLEQLPTSEEKLILSTSGLTSGQYLVRLKDAKGRMYRVKAVVN